MICYKRIHTNGSAIKVKENIITREDGSKIIEELYKKWDGEYIMRCNYSSKDPSYAPFQRYNLCGILGWLDVLEPSSSNVNLRKEIIDDYHKTILPHMERVAQDYVDEKLHYWIENKEYNIGKVKEDWASMLEEEYDVRILKRCLESNDSATYDTLNENGVDMDFEFKTMVFKECAKREKELKEMI